MIAWKNIAEPRNVEATLCALDCIPATDTFIESRRFPDKLRGLTNTTEDAALYPALYYLAKQFQPKRYLEVGVWRAYSTVVVASACPAVDIVGIDDWSNTKPATADEARKHVRDCGHSGHLSLLSGDSRKLVTPDLGTFDLILVDGCHAIKATMADLFNCAPLLVPGGHLVAHDLFAPYAPAHVPLWETFKLAHCGWQWFEHRVAPGIGIGRRPE